MPGKYFLSFEFDKIFYMKISFNLHTFSTWNECHSWKNWAASWQNQQNGMCTQRRLRSAWASAQADLSRRWAHSHFIGFDMRRLKCRRSREIIALLWHQEEKKKEKKVKLQNADTQVEGPQRNQLPLFLVRWLEPRHEKTCFFHMRTTKEQISLHIGAVWSAP